MIKYCVLLLGMMAVVISGCASGGAYVSAASFREVPIGATRSEIIASIGEPYSMTENKDGTVDYEYVERIKEGARNLQETHYVITLKDGKVVSKKIKTSQPPGYLFDSYQMQTTDRSE